MALSPHLLEWSRVSAAACIRPQGLHWTFAAHHAVPPATPTRSIGCRALLALYKLICDWGEGSPGRCAAPYRQSTFARARRHATLLPKAYSFSASPRGQPQTPETFDRAFERLHPHSGVPSHSSGIIGRTGRAQVLRRCDTHEQVKSYGALHNIISSLGPRSQGLDTWGCGHHLPITSSNVFLNCARPYCRPLLPRLANEPSMLRCCFWATRCIALRCHPKNGMLLRLAVWRSLNASPKIVRNHGSGT